MSAGDWESRVEAAAAAAAAGADEAAHRAEKDSEAQEAIRRRAHEVCDAHFMRARDVLLAREVPTNSRYAVGYKKGVRGAISGLVRPVHLDGWQFELFGAQEVWLCEDGRAWRADRKWQPGQSSPRLPRWGKNGYGPTGDQTGVGPDPVAEETYLPRAIEFDISGDEILDGRYSSKQPLGELLAEAVGRFIAS